MSKEELNSSPFNTAKAFLSGTHVFVIPWKRTKLGGWASFAFWCKVLAQVLLGYLVWQYTSHRDGERDYICRSDQRLQPPTLHCRALCQKGNFSLDWTECLPWLNCDDIISSVDDHDPGVQDGKSQGQALLGMGAVKHVHIGYWRGHQLAVNHLRHHDYEDDFLSGLTTLAKLQPSRHVTQLLGYCLPRLTYVTEYHPLGPPVDLDNILSRHSHMDTLKTRLRLCVNYIQILVFVHDGPQGTRVMCDSNSLPKILSQLLLTVDFRLVLNDVDALPLVDRAAGHLITCGNRPIYGEFIAPEQRWRDDVTAPPEYDERTDIWNVPDVCEYFLGHSVSVQPVRYRLFAIHKQCKEWDPRLRPSAADVLKVYQTLWDDVIH